MLALGTELLFEVRDDAVDRGSRLRCAVLHASGESVTIRFLDPAPSLRAGQGGHVFYADGGTFAMHDVTVRASEAASRDCVLELSGSSNPGPAREHYRVSATDRELRCVLDGERCRIVSLSPGGLGVVSRREHGIGASLELMLPEAARSVIGRVSVANARALDGGGAVYGLRLMRPVVPVSPSLEDALARRCTALQLDRLRRRSGG